MALRSTLIGIVGLTFAYANTVPTAKIRNGTLQGRYLDSFNQDLFLGVPFALAPRLDNPRPLNETWHSPFDASEYGPSCYGFGSNLALNLTQSEDCLNLNIIRPHEYSAEPLPVLLWIYGGGFRQGSNADPMWNLSYIVQTSVENKQPIIAVSINYRLSFLGFPGGNQTLEAGITNLALKDQRMALRWIQENIGAFNGNREKVTILGESGGAASVAMQLISYGGKGGAGLFRSTMMASGFATGINPTFAFRQQQGYDKIVANANCTSAPDQIACLRAAPFSALYPFEDKTGTSWAPVIDGDFIQEETFLELNAEHVTKVPIMLGCNVDEGLFVVNTLGTSPDTDAELKSLMNELFPILSNETVDALLTAYPDGAPAPPYSLPPDYAWCKAMHAANLTCNSEYRRTAALLGDYLMDSGRRYMAERWSSMGLPAYSYRFNTNPTSIPIVYWNGLGPGFALHGADLAYDFGLPAGFTAPIDYYPPVKDVGPHIQLSHVMTSKWVSFVHSMDPNSHQVSHAPHWPSYGLLASNYVFNATDKTLNVHVEADAYRAAGIGIWNKHILEADYAENAPYKGSLD